MIASVHHNQEFAVGLSRLADIENKGTLPTVYRLYSLCVIYRLDVTTVLSWYGISLSDLPADAARLSHAKTHILDFEPAERTSAVLQPERASYRAKYASGVDYHWRCWGAPKSGGIAMHTSAQRTGSCTLSSFRDHSFRSTNPGGELPKRVGHMNTNGRYISWNTDLDTPALGVLRKAGF